VELWLQPEMPVVRLDCHWYYFEQEQDKRNEK